MVTNIFPVLRGGKKKKDHTLRIQKYGWHCLVSHRATGRDKETTTPQFFINTSVYFVGSLLFVSIAQVHHHYPQAFKNCFVFTEKNESWAHK